MWFGEKEEEGRSRQTGGGNRFVFAFLLLTFLVHLGGVYIVIKLLSQHCSYFILGYMGE